MKCIRPVEIVTCCVCGREFDKIRMKRMFTGRARYICMECYNNGQRQVSARRSEFEESYRGKQIISESEKYK